MMNHAITQSQLSMLSEEINIVKRQQVQQSDNTVEKNMLAMKLLRLHSKKLELIQMSLN
jgi:hypothetical protein